MVPYQLTSYSKHCPMVSTVYRHYEWGGRGCVPSVSLLSVGREGVCTISKLTVSGEGGGVYHQ